MAAIVSPAVTVGGLSSLNAVFELPAGGAGVVTLQSIATFGTLTVIAEGTLDGTNYVALGLWDVTANAWIAGATGITAAGKLVRVSMDGLVKARLRVSAFTSGTAPIFMTLADEGQGVQVGN